MSDIQSTTNSETSQLFATMPTGVEFKKLRKRLLRQTSEALGRFGMVQPGARWLVALSGGKDSYGLLTILLDLKARDQLPVELIACNLDQGQPGFPKDVLPTYLKSLGVQHHIEYRDTYSIVKEKVPEGATYCGLCSRLRRANLYRIAREKGCTSVVLGHHRDDILETFLMNMFHGGRLAAMPPKLLNDEGDLTLLRPLSFCAEEDLQRFSDAMQFPIIPCNLCGSQDGLQRVMMKKMLADMEKADPGRKKRMMSAIANINPSHMLDHNLFNFAGLQPADQ
ncbi:tRNA 2-thiocytidine(32) synthetase TtcA [uncultured Maritalea sp.]|uniref:tRNA 2-thiocytidine(32) synthetase TtcA n=1 Tax=uncultured Maritalea sp. TaxID=757249 RepID=UPI002637CCDA|nr:tRNA 2-thiocytidine(32) synthetase TtcA [uncultured Maritalea sp.]